MAAILPCGPGSDPCTSCDLALMANNLFSFLTKVSIGLAILAGIVAGLLYLTSSGSSQLISRAKRFLAYSLIGFILTLLAWVIINVISQGLGYKSPQSQWWNLGDFKCTWKTQTPLGIRGQNDLNSQYLYTDLGSAIIDPNNPQPFSVFENPGGENISDQVELLNNQFQLQQTTKDGQPAVQIVPAAGVDLNQLSALTPLALQKISLAAAGQSNSNASDKIFSLLLFNLLGFDLNQLTGSSDLLQLLYASNQLNPTMTDAGGSATDTNDPNNNPTTGSYSGYTPSSSAGQSLNFSSGGVHLNGGCTWIKRGSSNYPTVVFVPMSDLVKDHEGNTFTDGPQVFAFFIKAWTTRIPPPLDRAGYAISHSIGKNACTGYGTNTVIAAIARNSKNPQNYMDMGVGQACGGAQGVCNSGSKPRVMTICLEYQANLEPNYLSQIAVHEAGHCLGCLQHPTAWNADYNTFKGKDREAACKYFQNIDYKYDCANIMETGSGSDTIYGAGQDVMGASYSIGAYGGIGYAFHSVNQILTEKEMRRMSQAGAGTACPAFAGGTIHYPSPSLLFEARSPLFNLSQDLPISKP